MKKKREQPRLRRMIGPVGASQVIELDEITPAAVREAFVVRFGPECAGWLVNRFRRQLRRYGAFSMHLPSGAEEPPWFQIAIGFLKRRAAKWSVVVRTQRGERHYRVVWTGGVRGPQELPVAIRRIQ